jgi:DNA-binding NarL/FixJ family response regulator
MDRATARILELYARGLTTREIAARLCVEHATVLAALAATMREHGATSVLELAVLVVRG